MQSVRKTALCVFDGERVAVSPCGSLRVACLQCWEWACALCAMLCRVCGCVVCARFGSSPVLCDADGGMERQRRRVVEASGLSAHGTTGSLGYLR